MRSYLDLTYTPGVLHKTPVLSKQAGGNPIAIISAIDALGRKIKPFTRLQKVLEDNVKNKNSTVYKVAHKVSEVGKSAGYGGKAKKKTHRKHKK
jgi:hypothetical protein